MLHPPAATVPLQESVPSLTVTVPVGVPLPGAVTLTASLMLTAWPTAEGSVGSAVMEAVVSALLTVCGSAAEAGLALKFASPLYVATRLRAPATVSVIEQLSPGSVPVQEATPSLTVTVPVGVPLPGAT